MNFKTTMTALSLMAGIAFLSACGGGGGSGSSGTPGTTATPTATTVATSTPTATPTATPEPTATPVATVAPTPAPGTAMVGKFIDSPVEGLYYETATKSGYTNQKGEFNYLQGETVRFKLYGTWLNTNAASVILTPADAENVSIDYSVNLLRLLQTLDIDHNPDNGIKLPPAAANWNTTTINFDQDIYAFENDSFVKRMLLDISTLSYQVTDLVPIKQALDHFNTSITGADSGEVILDVTGKTITHTEKDTLCNNSDTVYGTYTYTFDNEGLSYRSVGYGFFYGSYGTDANNVPTIGAATCMMGSTKGDKVMTFAGTTNTMNTFFGGPKFTYKTMNRIGVRSATVAPSNGLEAIVVIWHTPGTKKITYQRRYIKTEGSTSTAPLSLQTWVYSW